MSKGEPVAGAKQSHRTTPHHFMNPQQNWARFLHHSRLPDEKPLNRERGRLIRGMDGIIRAGPPQVLLLGSLFYTQKWRK